MSEQPYALDEPGISLVRGLLQLVEQRVGWAALAGIGAEPAPGGARAWARRLGGGLPTRGRQYLYPDPWQRQKLAALDATAAFWFRFLCLNQPQPIDAVRHHFGDQHRLTEYRSAGLLRDTGQGLVPMLRFLPLEGEVHLADGRLVEADPGRFGVDHANVTNQSLMQVDDLRSELRRRPATSMLEMGCGTGFVSLALRDRVAHRDGVDLSARAVEIARANARLKGDDQARYRESNLFSAVEGRYELILFNPWQDGESVPQLVLPFLQQAPAHLNPGGRIVLFLNTLEPQSPLLGQIAEWMQQASFQARRRIMMSYRASDRHMHALSMTWLQAGPGGPVQTRIDTGWLGLRLKTALTRG